MITRRFGRTEIDMPVLTCGGMRYQKAWSNDAEIDAEAQENLETTVRRGLEMGARHIETARGYGTSEMQLGRFLPSIPRDQFILQTKISPKYNKIEFLSEFDKSMRLLGMDYVDLLGIHGLNNEETWKMTVERGSLEAAQELKKQGRVRHIGFSTHGPTELIARACATGEFDYVNLHWYYIFQNNAPALIEAARQDMGVLIISPNDKGGKLYEPTEKLVDLCAPLSPMRFNALFCLARPGVHTLSIGVAKPSDWDEHLGTLERVDHAQTLTEPIVQRLDQAMADAVGAEWVRHWSEDLPLWQETPGEINLHTIIWLWNLAKAFDMTEYGAMRYNLLGNGGHWFAGQNAAKLAEGQVTEEEILRALNGYRFADRVIPILREAHDLMAGEEKKRLSQSES